MSNWSVGQKIGAGFAVMALLTVASGGFALVQLEAVIATEAEVDRTSHNLLDATTLSAAADDEADDLLSFFLSGDEKYLHQMADTRTEIERLLGVLRGELSAVELPMLAQLARSEAERRPLVERAVVLRKAGNTDGARKLFDEEILVRTEHYRAELKQFMVGEENDLKAVRERAGQVSSRATVGVLAIAVAGLVLAICLALVLSRILSRQLGAAISNIKSSSAELNAAATQQATGSAEQASATVEITTTIRELLATSKQISESSQQVSRIATEASTAATTGGKSVNRAQDAIGGIRRQVDVIVTHMLELGKKSQQIGGILEVINELAEQTNILAINATIESAGAGDAGKRFAVVADEIRKLADRVGGSSREIRTLVEDIRSSANTTVMATEDGSKSVDEGARQFAEVATGFQRIAEMVQTTRDAAREIELSTKQQTSAVEQVNLAMLNVAQAAKESEASARQTSDTSSQLATLSRDLAQLIKSEARA